MKLYHYWRSTSSWRVRWAMIAKGLKVEYVPIDLLTDESESPAHLARNPMGYIPVLEVPTQNKIHYLTESTAIIEWLEENYPKPALFPKDSLMRAHTRMLAEIINAGIQPLQNLTVTEHLSPDSNVRKTWTQHWIRRGFAAFEKLAQPYAGKMSIGDELSYADLFLIPQCYAADRNEVSIADYPTIARIHANAMKLPSAQAAHPDHFKP